jgi:hypothetical protein
MCTQNVEVFKMTTVAMVTNQMLKYKNNPSMVTAEQIFMKLHRNTKQKQVQCKLKK